MESREKTRKLQWKKTKAIKKTVCKKVRIDEHATSSAEIEKQCLEKAVYQKDKLDEHALQTEENLMHKSKAVNTDAKQNMDKFHKSIKYSIFNVQFV